MDVLVTGSAGFIGYHVAARLLADGHRVVGYDGLTPYYDPAMKAERHRLLSQFPRFTPLIGMLEDRDALDRAIAIAAPEIIVHLAAQPGVRYSLEAPQSYVSSNVVGTLNILELARRVRPRHLLLASSSSIYGLIEAVPWRETDRADQPVSLYAATKKSMELIAHSYAHLFDTPTTAFRFFTVYGPWGRPDMAPLKFLDAIHEGRPIDVYGHGNMQRDFTFVDDLVEAVMRLIDVVPVRGGSAIENDSLSPAAPFRAVNIGSGRPVGLLDFIATLETAAGRVAERRYMPIQAGDVPVTFASSDLLEALTGYRPNTPLVQGVSRLVEWYRAERAPKNSVNDQ
jgi:UDP-glucuronate 4-epimerase